MKVGQLFFAMIDSGETFDPDVHNREDMDVFTCKISQSEGEFARAQITIQNPSMGLLSPTRKQYLFISCDFDGDVVPLFYGRVIGFPTDFGQEIITVDYIAQKETWAADQDAFLETLKVAPYYNELLISEDQRDEPTEILAARNALLHWDRFPDGDVSLSDIIEGSSTIDIGDEYFYDSLQTSIGEPPLKRIDGTIEVQWIQNAKGVVDVGTAIKNEFVNSGGAPSPKINTLTPHSFEAAWNGANIPTGYKLIQSALSLVITGIGSAFLKSPSVNVSSEFFPTEGGGTFITRATNVPRVWYNGVLKVMAEYSQKRREILSYSLEAVTQEFSLSRENIEVVPIQVQDPTALAQGSVLSPDKPSFFYESGVFTVYGEGVVQNVLLRARARLMKAARVVEASFQMPITSLEVLNLTCDKNIHIEDERLPNGKMVGKVLGYSLTLTEKTSIAEVTIGSIIGTGVDSSGVGTVLASTTYNNEDTISIDPTMESAVIYSLDSPPSIVIPIDVALLQSDPSYAIDDVIVSNHGQSQNNNFASTARPDLYLNSNGTGVQVDLKSMNPEEELLLEFDLTTQPLTLPQHIDLESTT